MDNTWIPVDKEHEVAFMEATGEVFWDGYRPILCSHCRQATLRYFWRQYRTRTQPDGTTQRMGTSWTWCPNCRLFYSGCGGRLPEWWPEHDPIPDVKDLGPSGVGFDLHWGQVLQAITVDSSQRDQQDNTTYPKSDEMSFPPPTKRVLYQLLFDALIEIRLLGYASNDKVVWVLAHVLHNGPLQFDRLDRGDISIRDIMLELEERAHRHGIERWLHGRLGEIAKHHPDMLEQDETTADAGEP